MIYDSNRCSDFARHLLFGTVHHNVSFVFRADRVPPFNDGAFYYFITSVYYHDGTIERIASRRSLTLWGGLEECEHHEITGTILDNVDVSAMLVFRITYELEFEASGPDSLQITQLQSTTIFQSVSASTSYLAMLLTGGQLNAQINMCAETHSETKVDPAGAIATFTDPTPDLAAPHDVLPVVVAALRKMHFDFTFAHEPNHPPEFVSAGFGDKLKKFFGGVYKVVRQPIESGLGLLSNAVLPGSGALTSPLIHAAGDAIQRKFDSRSYRRRGRAASFSTGRFHDNFSIGFPVIYGHHDEFLVKFCRVLPGDRFRNQPNCVSTITDKKFYAEPPDFTGRSCESPFF